MKKSNRLSFAECATAVFLIVCISITNYWYYAVMVQYGLWQNRQERARLEGKIK